MTFSDLRLLTRLIRIMRHPQCGAIVVTIFDKDTGAAECFGNSDGDALAVNISGQALELEAAARHA